MIKFNSATVFLLILSLFSASARVFAAPASLANLRKAYPDYIQDVTSHYIKWKDGTRMQIEGSFSLFNGITRMLLHLNRNDGSLSAKDVQREHYEDVFRKMYGNSQAEVKRHLTVIYWMPNVFGTRYPLLVTTINGVDKRLRRISAALEKLPPSYYKYLDRPAGSYYWRQVEGESYLSTHSFGIAIDINSSYSNYWLWDFKKLRLPISELRNYRLVYHNRIPMRIVDIFEKEGFYWGGRWYYYDTMHFEYRPDLLLSA